MLFSLLLSVEKIITKIFQWERLLQKLSDDMLAIILLCQIYGNQKTSKNHFIVKK